MENEQDQEIDLSGIDAENTEEVIAEILSEDDDSSETLVQQLDEANSKADENWDLLMRSRAELDNLKKRQDRDLENAHKFALEKFVDELLMVWDSLQMGAIAAQDELADIEKLREGTDLTLKLMSDVMGKFGVNIVDPENELFNPDFHQAISMVPRDDIEPNTVVSVVQKGYQLNGRLIRPAMVAVSQEPPE